jgi:hypothetical protein
MKPDPSVFHRFRGRGMKKVIVILVLIAGVIAGCSGARDGSQVNSSREILTANEIAKTSALNAYDAVRMRRPAFLTPRAPRSLDPESRSGALPVVYLNGVYYGEAESLRDILIRDVKEIRYLDPKEATFVYGSGHIAGVINVTTKIN